MALKLLNSPVKTKTFYIKTTKKYGRGVYAARNISKGETIEVCEILILSRADTIKIDKTDLKWYVFKYNDHQDCLVLGNGELFNHSNNANTSYILLDNKMYFVSKKDIKKGRQLFTDYNQDAKVDTKTGYKVNL